MTRQRTFFRFLSTSHCLPRQRERATGVVDFRVNFQMRNKDKVDELFDAVTNHTGPKYGQYLTTAQLNKLINPSVQEKAPVFAWLRSRGCSYTDMGQHARVRCAVAKVEGLLQTRLHVAVNKKNRRLSDIKAFDGVHVPDHLLSVLSKVHPIGGSFMVLQPPRPLGFVIRKDKAGPVNVAVVPQTLEAQYAINNRSVHTPFGVVSQAVAEFSNDNSYSPSDLVQFSQGQFHVCVFLFFLNNNFSGMLVNIEGTVTRHGPFNDNPPDAESTLDIQAVAATGRNASSVFWVVPGWLHEWLGDITAESTPPEISSISWGADER